MVQPLDALRRIGDGTEGGCVSDDKDQSVELFLHADRKIEKVVADVSELVKKDMGLDHKMDMVIQSQTQLKEGFDHSRTTGHKTWEAVQKMVANIESLAGSVKILEGRTVTAEKLTDRVDKRFDKFVIGMFITVFCTILMTVLTFLSRHT